MLSQADQTTLNSYDTQIAAMEDQASSQGNAGSDYNQQLDDWLAEIKDQLGAKGSDDAPAMRPNGTNGGDRPSGQANGSSADGGTGTDGTNTDGTDGSDDSTTPTDADLAQLQSILAQKGATTDQQGAALLGALQATQAYGQGQMNALIYAAQEYGYSGVNTVMAAKQTSQNIGLDANGAAGLAFEALAAQQSGGADAAGAYIFAAGKANGMGGAENVLQAIWTSQASGASSDSISGAAWETSLKDQQQAFAATLNETAQSDSSTKADETQDYQKVTEDLKNGGDLNTIANKALSLSQSAADNGDFALAEVALDVGKEAKAGKLTSDDAAAQTLESIQPGDKTVLGVAWAP